MTTKTLVYKVARFNNETGGKNLQDLIALALKKRKTALSRKQQGDSENQFSLINYNGPHKGLRVGEFFDYTHGHKQPLAEFDDEAESLTISALAPPDKKKRVPPWYSLFRHLEKFCDFEPVYGFAFATI